MLLPLKRLNSVQLSSWNANTEVSILFIVHLSCTQCLLTCRTGGELFSGLHSHLEIPHSSCECGQRQNWAKQLMWFSPVYARLYSSQRFLCPHPSLSLHSNKQEDLSQLKNTWEECRAEQVRGGVQGEGPCYEKGRGLGIIQRSAFGPQACGSPPQCRTLIVYTMQP